ncbi:preprotein translocase subunit SecE [Mycobacterium shimoidei]|uniref:preprotein translocase subunit SecE n=1 Tax=Mycobacterium shimoidei TaxID=29313 RepID=UPI0008494DD5|nr:preprotein translocase subunit SecE [Mycobacterium shimoidei]MCV7260679.1 preprotein translocase subunit SecE [Mycobacterium shimoidei]ODR13866.1 preprotein translocase subunit SecE [Mycobacterium shimoidei]ORW76424.1 preprotein translocase subunit SecE [Mycobacterium shimoidei]
MSDERDGADAGLGSLGNETEEAGGRHARTAVATRPQRPTGKRSRQRVAAADDGEPASEAVEVAEDEEGAKPKKAKTKKAGKDGKPKGPNPIIFVYNYLKQVVGELRKVIWPNRKQQVTYTSVVLAFLVFMVALVAAADFGLAKLVMLVFGNG